MVLALTTLPQSFSFQTNHAYLEERDRALATVADRCNLMDVVRMGDVPDLEAIGISEK
jgi:hypothetical protein